MTQATHRLIGAIVSIVAIALTAMPVLRNPIRDDGFPLSTYPMFASKRALTQTFTYAVAWAGDGERRRIKPRHVANAEVMQARVAFDHARRDKRLPELCRRIAGRVAADGKLDDVVRIDIVTGTHEAIGYLLRDERGKERVLATCTVPR